MEPRRMSTSRRDFLKTTIIAGAGVVLPPTSGMAEAASASSPLRQEATAIETASAGPGYTRGIGVYSGDPAEDFSPSLEIDDSTYRNLALLRPAYHSSSYDYNLTAQLITDGIKDTHLPDWIGVSINPF